MKSLVKRYLKYLYKNTVILSRKKFTSLLKKNPKAKLLDCGCWDGSNTMIYADIIGTKNIVGVDIDKEKIIKAKEKGMRIYESDLNEKIPVANNSADVVIANHIIEHLSNPPQFINEAYRALDNNGYILIATPNLASWHNIFALLIGIQPFSGPHTKNSSKSRGIISEMHAEKLRNHFKRETSPENLRHLVVFTTKSLKKLLMESGFKIERVYGFGYYPLPPFLANIITKIDPYHAHYIIMRARK